MSLISFKPLVPKDRKPVKSEFKKPTKTSLKRKYELDCGCKTDSKVYIPLTVVYDKLVETWETGRRPTVTDFKTDPRVENGSKLRKNELDQLINTLKWDGTIPFNFLHTTNNLSEFDQQVEQVQKMLKK